MRTDTGSVVAHLKNGAGGARKQPDKQNSYPLAISEGARGGFGELLPEQSSGVWVMKILKRVYLSWDSLCFFVPPPEGGREIRQYGRTLRLAAPLRVHRLPRALQAP